MVIFGLHNKKKLNMHDFPGGTSLCLLVVCICLSLSMLVSGCEKQVITVEDDIVAMKNEKQHDPEKMEQELGKVSADSMEYKEEKVSDLIDIGCCAILIPTDFVRDEENPGMYISERYPLDSGNIYYTVIEDEAIGAVNKELTAKQYEEAVENAYASQGNPVDLIIDEFSDEFIENVPCFKVRCHFNIGDRDVQQLAYIVMASKTHVITYTQLSDDELLADFLIDEGEIKLVREISQA